MSRRLNLIMYFFIKDIKGRYAGSGLGIFWSVVLPIFQILLYWLVFSTIMKIRPYTNAQIPYVFYLLSTYFFWLAISESAGRSGMTIIENAELVKKVSFPNVALPIAVTLSGYLHGMIGVAIFIIVYALSGGIHPHMFLIIPVLLLQLIFSLGVSMLMSAIVPYIRDLQQVIAYLLQGMFFLSPIIYNLEAFPERFRSLAFLNPITVYIESYHKIIFEKTVPGAGYLGGMIFISFFFLFLGMKVFNKLKEGFADIL
jgi:ABC-type polysaccharide/polyol phosphate export permease